MRISYLLLLSFLGACATTPPTATCTNVWQWSDKDQEDVSFEMKFLDHISDYKKWAREVYQATPPSTSPNSPAIELSAAVLTLPDASKVNIALLDYESIRKQSIACKGTR